ncbi:MAG: 50S ribosomal protein L35ae [Thermoproteota archaeon]
MEGVTVPGGEQKVEVRTGLVLGYQRGSNTQYEEKVLLRIDGVSTDREAARFIGWKVLYIDSKGNKYIGKILRTHGRHGVVVSRFRPNLPGQAIGGTVYIYPRGVELVFEEEK